MATFIVTSLLDVVNAADDATVFTLREALAASEANGDGLDNIIFSAAIDGGTITLTSGPLAITTGTVAIYGDIEGDGALDITLSGGSSYGFLTVASNGNVTIDGLAFTHGRVNNGYFSAPQQNAYLISNAGTLSISNSIIQNSTAIGRYGNGGTLTGGDGQSGGNAAIISSSGTLNVTDTLFSNNSVFGGNGGYGYSGVYFGTSGGQGGNAAVVISSNILNIQNSNFVYSTVVAGNGGAGGSYLQAYKIPDGYGGYFYLPGVAGAGGDGGNAALVLNNGGAGRGELARYGGSLSSGPGGLGGNFGSPYAGPNGANGSSLAGLLNIGGGVAPNFDNHDGQSVATLGGLSESVVAFLTADNVFWGMNGNDTMHGSDGNDDIAGGAGNDQLFGDADNDVIEGGLGNDIIDGGTNGTAGDTVSFAGFVALPGSSTGITVSLAVGAAQNTGAGLDTITNIENVIGSDFNDTIAENSGKNSIQAGRGNDSIALNGAFANVAGEVFDGGDGIDELLLNGAGIITHNFRDDTILNMEKINLGDSFPTGVRTVLLNANQFGGTGISSTAQFIFDIFNDNTEFVDVLMGTATSLSLANLTFQGSTLASSFVITGDSDSETITGSSIKDVIKITGNGAGRDTIDGGGGSTDTLDLAGMTQFAWVNLAYNGDEVQTKDGAVWRGMANMINVENVNGTNFNDFVYGDAQANTVNGNGGNDTIYGRAGNDVLQGGIGSDSLYGEANDDTLIADEGSDYMNGGSGNDLFQFSITFGNLLDTADGDQGVDTVDASNFIEMAWVDLATAGYELYTKTAGGVAWQALANLSNIENVIGSNQNDEMYGDGANNFFDGGFGDDKLDGRGGYDTILGGDGNDTITGGDLSDTLDGGAYNDTFIFSSTLTGIDTVEGGSGSDTADLSSFTTKAWVDFAAATEIYTFNGAWKVIANTNSVENAIGSAVADELYGNGDSNVFVGGGGADIIAGRAGADTLSGGTGSDTFKFAVGDSGQDLATLDAITDFAKGAVGVGDKIDFVPALLIGGSAAAANANTASINATTGVASFLAGSGTDLVDALNDITASFAAGGQTAGEFAFFKIAGVGPTYMLVSDGSAGLTAGDVLIQLSNITSIGSINITSGDLTILT